MKGRHPTFIHKLNRQQQQTTKFVKIHGFARRKDELGGIYHATTHTYKSSRRPDVKEAIKRLDNAGFEIEPGTGPSIETLS